MKDFDLDEFSNLGNVLLRRGALTRAQLGRAVEEQGRRKGLKLGELLVELKLCSSSEVEEALREQQMHRLPPPSQQMQQAQAVLKTAFAKVSHEADRLTARRTRSGIMELKISPEET